MSVRTLSVVSAATLAIALGLSSAANAEIVLNTSLGSVAAPGSTTTDATGTRSTNTGAGRVNEVGGSANDWIQRDVGGGATVGITTDYARSGNGSVFFNSVDGNSKASLEYFFSTAQSLSSFGGASYDWYRDASSNGPAGNENLVPSLRFYVTDGTNNGTLIFEPYYQGNVAPVEGSWQTSLIGLGSTVWDRPTPLNQPAGSSCDPSACFNTLGAFMASNQGLMVTGFSTGIGSGWNGTFTGAVDNITFKFGDNTSTYNFEVESGAIPEPKTWGLMLLGFGGLGAMLRRARRARATVTA